MTPLIKAHPKMLLIRNTASDSARQRRRAYSSSSSSSSSSSIAGTNRKRRLSLRKGLGLLLPAAGAALLVAGAAGKLSTRNKKKAPKIDVESTQMSRTETTESAGGKFRQITRDQVLEALRKTTKIARDGMHKAAGIVDKLAEVPTQVLDKLHSAEKITPASYNSVKGSLGAFALFWSALGVTTFNFLLSICSVGVFVLVGFKTSDAVHYNLILQDGWQWWTSPWDLDRWNVVLSRMREFWSAIRGLFKINVSGAPGSPLAYNSAELRNAFSQPEPVDTPAAPVTRLRGKPAVPGESSHVPVDTPAIRLRGGEPAAASGRPAEPAAASDQPAVASDQPAAASGQPDDSEATTQQEDIKDLFKVSEQVGNMTSMYAIYSDLPSVKQRFESLCPEDGESGTELNQEQQVQVENLRKHIEERDAIRTKIDEMNLGLGANTRALITGAVDYLAGMYAGVLALQLGMVAFPNMGTLLTPIAQAMTPAGFATPDLNTIVLPAFTLLYGASAKPAAVARASVQILRQMTQNPNTTFVERVKQAVGEFGVEMSGGGSYAESQTKQSMDMRKTAAELAADASGGIIPASIISAIPPHIVNGAAMMTTQVVATWLVPKAARLEGFTAFHANMALNVFVTVVRGSVAFASEQTGLETNAVDLFRTQVHRLIEQLGTEVSGVFKHLNHTAQTSTQTHQCAHRDEHPALFQSLDKRTEIDWCPVGRPVHTQPDLIQIFARMASLVSHNFLSYQPLA